MPTLPTDFDWGGTQTEPSAGLQANGYADRDKPAHDTHNWLFNQLSTLVKWAIGMVDGSGRVTIANGGTGAGSAAAGFDNLAPTVARGDLIYRDTAGNVALGGNTSTTKKWLRQTGTGTASSPPVWDLPVLADVVAWLGFTPESTANKGVASGYAGLDSGGKVALSQAPNWARTTFTDTTSAVGASPATITKTIAVGAGYSRVLCYLKDASGAGFGALVIAEASASDSVSLNNNSTATYTYFASTGGGLSASGTFGTTIQLLSADYNTSTGNLSLVFKNTGSASTLKVNGVVFSIP